MTPRIETLSDKKLLGKRLTMSLAQNRMAELWQSFMPLKRAIQQPVSTELISLVVYSPNHFEKFSIHNEFERWAAIEVSSFENAPSDLETFVLKGGLYAVFEYKGLSTDSSIFQYIFGTWLPASDYVLDNRPHFEVLGAKYKNNDPDSEEEIWIPIRLK